MRFSSWEENCTFWKYTPQWYPHPEMDSQEKTPEMNELEPGLKSLKIWAHNFEKQKSYSLLKLSSEMLRGRIGWLFAGFGKCFNLKKWQLTHGFGHCIQCFIEIIIRGVEVSVRMEPYYQKPLSAGSSLPLRWEVCLPYTAGTARLGCRGCESSDWGWCRDWCHSCGLKSFSVLPPPDWGMAHLQAQINRFRVQNV